MRYLIEADNPGGTFSTVDRFDWPGEIAHNLRACADLEGRIGMPRRLSVWCTATATCLAVWNPYA